MSDKASAQGLQGKTSISSSGTWHQMSAATTISSERRRLGGVQPDQAPKPMTKYEDELESKFEALHIEPKDAIMHPKMEGGQLKQGDEAVQLTCNAFGLLVSKSEVYRYEVKILGERGGNNAKVAYLNRRPKDDAPIMFQRDDCRAVFNSIINNPENAAFFKISDGIKPTQVLAYDLTGYLYSLNKLDFTLAPQNALKEEDEISLLMAQTEEFTRFAPRFKRVLFCIRNNEAAPLHTTDFEKMTNHLEVRFDASSRSFIETATSQFALHDPTQHVMFETNTSYLFDPTQAGFTANDAMGIGNDKYLALGTQKTIRMIEGPNREKKGGAPALFIECKKTPFYNQCDVLHFATTVLSMSENHLAQAISNPRPDHHLVALLDKALSGLYVFSRFDERIDSFHKVIRVVSTSPSEKVFTAPGGNEISIVDYYHQKYGVELQFPNAPMAECSFERGEPPKRSMRGTLFFPLEVLSICDNQRVHQQTPELIQNIIKACAVPPVRNFHHIMNSRNAWSFEKNAICQKAGIRVTSRPMNFNGRKLCAPSIRYASENSAPSGSRSTWRMMQTTYIMPASIGTWGCYYLAERPQGQERILQQFAKRFIQECITKGMQIGDPSDIGGIVANEIEMEKKFKAAQSAHCEFMLFIHDDREKAGHSIFKLLERRYDIPTQGVRLSTVNNIFQKRQNQTMENVVNKTNVKMGGLNFSLSLNPSCFKNLLSDDILYIGFAISKPAGGLSTGSSAPDVLGYAANIKQFPFEFIGDFSFVTSGIESNFKLETFGEIVKRCVVRFRENRKKNPRHVIIYRHGCDDGLFRTVIKYEVPFIEKKLAEVSDGSEIHWSLIVPNKMHTARILRSDVADEARSRELSGMRPPEQNIMPGTVVDNALVHPHFAEFFLCSHAALQGTAKVPRYTILFSKSGLTLDDFERITWNLSFGHQIVNMTVSLPAPSYIANRYAERGRMLYNQNGKMITTDDELRKLTEELCHFNTDYLRDLRVNA